tara:strand:+ start:83 stop:646 length:564 start_codon:yes stop_codon:yes gene_type:complete
MGIKIKYRDPKTTDFTKNDIVINQKDGNLFYKSELGLHKLSEKSYHLQNFHFDGDNTGNGYQYINWVDTPPFGPSGLEASKQLIIPFKGTIHKLLFKITGNTQTDTNLRMYKNQKGGSISQYRVLQILNHPLNQGDGTYLGEINEIDLNIDVEAGDDIGIQLTHFIANYQYMGKITGQLLYSQTITI